MNNVSCRVAALKDEREGWGGKRGTGKKIRGGGAKRKLELDTHKIMKATIYGDVRRMRRRERAPSREKERGGKREYTVNQNVLEEYALERIKRRPSF